MTNRVMTSGPGQPADRLAIPCLASGVERKLAALLATGKLREEALGWPEGAEIMELAWS